MLMHARRAKVPVSSERYAEITLTILARKRRKLAQGQLRGPEFHQVLEADFCKVSNVCRLLRQQGENVYLLQELLSGMYSLAVPLRQEDGLDTTHWLMSRPPGRLLAPSNGAYPAYDDLSRVPSNDY